MELLAFIGAFVALDIAAYFWGNDSRDMEVLKRHDRARHLAGRRPSDF